MKMAKEKVQEQVVEDFSEAITGENLPTIVSEQVWEMQKILSEYAAQLPSFNSEELITMCHGGELGWRTDPDGEDDRVEVLERVYLWDYKPYYGIWVMEDGKRYLEKRPITDKAAEAEDYKPRIDLYVEYENEERVIGLPTVGFNAFIKKLQRYQGRNEDMRDRWFTLKTKAVTSQYGPITIPIFKELKDKPSPVVNIEGIEANDVPL
jgi:hypothetical protein